jgi:hypothetical protein
MKRCHAFGSASVLAVSVLQLDAVAAGVEQVDAAAAGAVVAQLEAASAVFTSPVQGLASAATIAGEAVGGVVGVGSVMEGSWD